MDLHATFTLTLPDPDPVLVTNGPTLATASAPPTIAGAARGPAGTPTPGATT
ncbi:hypothetical protein [Paraconexibacter algicola]|uniref:hypothetical protein n=1 Tax=Paraconexibacter algicola TaxID=2133960 RepID=UPI001304D630|nr:hypothetical protein [Paraconexibacter algicola]